MIRHFTLTLFESIDVLNPWCTCVLICALPVVLSLFVKHLASSEIDDNRLLKF